MSSRIASVRTLRASYLINGQFKFFPSAEGKRAARETVTVRIADDAGQVGWGQSVPSPTWSYETVESVETTIDRHLGPALIGMDPFDLDGIWRVMNRMIAGSFSTGQPICKAGIDLALFDLTGRILRKTAAERWGRKGHDSITLSWTVDARSVAEAEASLAEAKCRGYRHFNVKVGTDAALDLEVCRTIRRMAPEAFVWVDANGGYDLETALAMGPKLADLGVAALEQPLPANCLSGYAALRRQKALPILMDEAIVSLGDLREFHQLGLLDGVAMKVSRSGGLTEARRMVEYMEQEGLLFFASGLTDPDLSLASCLILFGAYDLPRPAALNGPQFLEGTILTRPLYVEGDVARLPVGYGLGVEVDDGWLAMGERVQ
jgi:muconate cycloisomerase